MMSRRLEIAGVGFQLEMDRVFSLAEPYSLFLNDTPGPDDYRYSFSAGTPPKPEGPEMFRDASLAVFGKDENQQRFLLTGRMETCYAWIHFRQGEKTSVIYVPEKAALGGALITRCLGLERQLLRRGRVVLHASYVDIGGQALLFTAPSGTGKSTQAELWCKYRGATVLNGDRVALSVEDGKVMAHGVPMSGSSGICHNRSLPVKAIVCLEQGPENRLRDLYPGAAFVKLLSGISVNAFCPQDEALLPDCIANIIQHTTVVHLSCLPDRNAVDLLAERIGMP